MRLPTLRPGEPEILPAHAQDLDHRLAAQEILRSWPKWREFTRGQPKFPADHFYISHRGLALEVGIQGDFPLKNRY
jgi:hypothetical protein